ncbi:MAG TPA: GntR family transcriptional regulator [Clostridiales bacterium]|nr:GntR family transcriptional regulator [Clostridiales bacterium]
MLEGGRFLEEFNLQKEFEDKYSLRGRVFNKIREDILGGVYKENDELRENTLANELGVSRTPVREALRNLEIEGLVSIIPNRGAYVTGISEKDIRDIYIIRSYLEGLCAKWACQYITQQQLDEMDETIYLSTFHARRSHFDQLLDLDNKFHDLIYKASGSKMLNHVLTDFHHYVERVRKVSISRKDRAMRTIKEHEAILEAIRKRDGDLAETLAHEHMMQTIKNINEINEQSN